MILINRSRCCYCGTCVPICPTSAIELNDACIEISSNCTMCKTCIQICPVGALEAVNEESI